MKPSLFSIRTAPVHHVARHLQATDVQLVLVHKLGML